MIYLKTAAMPVSLLERAFTLAALFFYTGALACFIGDDNPVNIFTEISAWIGFAITLGLLVINFRAVMAIAPRDILLWLLVLITLISPLWSDLPVETVQNVIPLLRVTVFGIYFATRYTLREQVELIAWTFGSAAIISVFVSLALPFYGVMGYGIITNSQQIVHQGVWRGAFIHRNILSAMMTICFLSSLFCMIRVSGFRWVGWVFLGLSTFLILISAAKASPVILVIVLLLIPFYRAMRWNYHTAVPFFVIMALIVGSAVVFSVVNAEEILNSLGRDITLSGRTNYWELMLYKAQERPWLGYGYDAFWEGDWQGEVADVWRYLQDGDEPPHPHNGFLALWLNVGLVGLSIFVLHWLRTFSRAVQWLRMMPTVEGLVPIAYLTLFVLMNLTETTLMQADIVWLLYVSTSLTLVSGEVVETDESGYEEMIEV
jgi:exopolysaccharide production protein ExoQ